MKLPNACSKKLPVFALLSICSACSLRPSPAPAAQASPTASVPSVAVAAAVPVAAPSTPAITAREARVSSPTNPKGLGRALRVKRFVVAAGVKDREPLDGSEPLSANGSAIYAFAELANPEGESENVRITFERKGSKERVGDVSLPVPGKTSRHRTWAFTRNIFAAGVWEAVLWSETGAELGRTAFEVKAA